MKKKGLITLDTINIWHSDGAWCKYVSYTSDFKFEIWIHRSNGNGNIRYCTSF